MNLNKFQKNAIKTESLVDSVEVSKEGLVNTLRAFAALTEVLDMLKKNIFYGKSIDSKEMQTQFMIAEKLSGYLTHQQVWDTTDKLDINSRVFHALIGIITESGELSEALIDALSENELDTVNVLEEFGDIAWYQAIAYDEFDVDPYSPLTAVINKLRARYPNKFTSDDAINRDIETERSILEGRLFDESNSSG